MVGFWRTDNDQARSISEELVRLVEEIKAYAIGRIADRIHCSRHVHGVRASAMRIKEDYPVGSFSGEELSVRGKRKNCALTIARHVTRLEEAVIKATVSGRAVTWSS